MIINESKERILARNLRVCRSLLLKAKGLMFSKRIKDFGLVFEFNSEKRRALHNFFVFFPTDVIFLNKKEEIVEIKENFRPFMFYMPKRRSEYIIELPVGSVAKTGSEIGDRVNFK